MDAKEGSEESSWEHELTRWVNNPPLAKDNRVSSNDNNVLVKPSKVGKNNGFRNSGHKPDLLPLVLAAMVDLIGDNAQDGGRMKSVLQQLFVRCGWVPGIYLSDNYVSLRNFIKNMLNSYSPLMTEIPPAVDQSLLGRELRFSPFATSRYRSDFEELDLIGKGGFGKVYLVRSRIDNCKYAMKKISFTFKKNKPMIKAINEVRTLASLQHKNIVRYYSAWAELDFQPEGEDRHLQIREMRTSEIVEDDKLNGTSEESEENAGVSKCNESWLVSSGTNHNLVNKGRFWNLDESESSSAVHSRNLVESTHQSLANSSSHIKTCVPYWTTGIPKATMYVQMELCTRTLDDYFTQRALVPSVPDSQLFNQNVIKQLAAALTYIHQKNIIHRDVKPCNLFLRDCGSKFPRVLLGDFGLACHDSNNSFSFGSDSLLNGDNDLKYHSAGVGTALYSAPEQSSSNYDTSVDIYSAGIVTFELYSSFSTVMERNEKIGQLRKGFLPQRFRDSWPIETELILSMCQYDPTKRPRAFEVANRLQSLEKESVELLKRKVIASRETIEKLKEKIFTLESEIKRMKSS